MKITNKSVDKQHIEKLDELRKNVSCTVIGFAEQTAELQQEISELFIAEFGVNGPIDMNSLSKLARITSYYASSEYFQGLAKYQRTACKMFITWQTLRKEAMECRSKDREIFASIPAKLCFFYFYNGELCRAVVCLLDYIDLSDDTLAKEAALRWLMFLGETELIEKKLKTWKMDKSSKDMFSATEFAMNYLKKSEYRVEMLEKLMKLRDKVKSDPTRSFSRYELASYVSWLCSTLSNVPVGSALRECEFPDRVSHIQEAALKSDSLVRNRIPGLASSQFDNSVNASIWPFLDGHQEDSNYYVHIGSTIAWHFEMRRECALVNVTTAQTRDSMSAMILNLRVALKSASFFRVLQTTNTLAYYSSIIEEAGSEKNAKLMRVSCVNLLSSNPIIVRCSTPKETGATSRAHTPMAGSSVSEKQNTMRPDLADLLGDLELLDEQSFHPITRSCVCNVCTIYPLHSSFAAEYMMSYAIHSDFSQLSIKHFNDEFARIRERGMSSQVLMHRDSSVRPRPNIIQNEIFGMCVIRWLTKKLDSKESADEDTMEIFNNALKIVRYLQQRTTDMILAVTQLGRQLEFPMECNYSWMRPTIRKPRVKATIDCAVDILRAVSPFGRRPKVEKLEKNLQPFDKERFEKVRLAMRNEMNHYGHILYREWRCRLFAYVGRTSRDPWEAAYAWAESTQIGARNAVQSRLEKCKRGLVTMSGHDRFKTCVQSMPDEMTLVQIAMADDKTIYLVKLHADRDPIIMPLAHYSQAVELMDKFTFLLDEDEMIAKYPGDITPEEFWKRRKIVDGRMMTFVDEVQKHFLGVAASLLMPSGQLGPKAAELAIKIHKLSKGGLLLGEAKEMVYQSKLMDAKSWEALILRFCEMRTTDEKFKSFLPLMHRNSVEVMNQDDSIVTEKKYTYLVICPHLSQFCWERLPIFDEYPYVGRQVSIHSTFSQLEAMKSQEKQIPLQIDVQNAYYILDPDNNLGETQKRMVEYINKFNWEGTVGSAPKSNEISAALSQRDAFFFIGHGSGSSVMPRSVLKQSTCNAISLLMGCGSVRTIPQALGFDGKTAILDYAMAKCPLIVGCLWTVTDGEIDRFLIRMIDDCFEDSKSLTGIDKLRQLSEAMHEARSKARLKYLTGAAVVMYGLPVVAKQTTPFVEKDQRNLPQTPKTSARTSMRMETVPKTPKQEFVTSKSVPMTPIFSNNENKSPSRARMPSRVLKTPRQVKTFQEEDDEAPKRSTTRQLKPLVAPPIPATPTTRTTRSSARTPSRSRNL